MLNESNVTGAKIDKLSSMLGKIWARLNLPMLLFRVGLLTLMKMDYLIYLDIWCPSLPIIF